MPQPQSQSPRSNSRSSSKIRLACVQDSPVSFDLDATLRKFERLTKEAAQTARAAAVPVEEGAEAESGEGAGDGEMETVVVFPEAFLSAYPRGYDFGAKIGSRDPAGRRWFERYHSSSVPVSDVDGPEMRAIRAAARDNNVTLVVGVIERCDGPVSGPRPEEYGSAAKGGSGTIYCTALTIGPDGTLLAAHRKLMPTASERLVWGQGDGAGIRVADTPAGRVGSVICWENYMPLLRYSMYAKGVEIYCAPTADCRDTWASSMRHIAAEGRCFVVSVCQFATRADYPEDYPAFQDAAPDHIITRGGSVIVGPLGDVLAGPLFDKRGILVTVVDRKSLVEARMDFDSCGHYGRSDIFHLSVDDKSRPAASFSG